MSHLTDSQRAAGLRKTDVTLLAKITPDDLDTIMQKVAKAILAPHAFTNDDFSLAANGKSADVYTEKAVRHDLLGWIVKFSYQHWANLKQGRKSIGYIVSQYIDSHIRTLSDNRIRLMTLGEAGPELASKYLVYAASRLPVRDLPVLYPYAKDWEDPEDKAKRDAKREERKQAVLKAVENTEPAQESESEPVQARVVNEVS